MTSPIDRLAHRIRGVEAEQRRMKTPQLAQSSVEDGAINVNALDGTTTMIIGKQFDGTSVAAPVVGPVPLVVPSAPAVTAAPGGLKIAWDGSFTDPTGVAPMDYIGVDIALSTDAGFDPVAIQPVSRITSARGGEVFVALEPGTYYAALVLRTAPGKASTPSMVVSGSPDAISADASDGVPPATSPVPVAVGGIGVLFVKWAPVENADDVTYDVYIADEPGAAQTAASAEDATYLAGSTHDPDLTIKTLPYAQPDPETGDFAQVQANTPYYVCIVARDADGSAAPGVEVFGVPIQVTSGDIAAATITGVNIAAETLTGDLFAARIVLATQMITGSIDQDPSSDTYGQVVGPRIANGPDGFTLTDGDDVIVNFPTDRGQNPFIDADLVARGLTVKGGATFESPYNEIARDSLINLANGTSAPLQPPTGQVGWNSIQIDTITPHDVDIPADSLFGPMPFDPTQATSLAWVDDNVEFAVIQNGSQGARIWRFNPDGSYKSSQDLANWRYTGAVYTAREGYVSVDLIGQYGGRGGTFWVSCHDVNGAQVNRRLTREVTSKDPTLGWDAVNGQLMVIENDAANGTIIKRVDPYPDVSGDISTISRVQTAANTGLGAPGPAGGWYGSVYGLPNRYYVASKSGVDIYVYDTATRPGLVDAERFPTAESTTIGLTVTPAGQVATLGADGQVHFYENNLWSDGLDYWHFGITLRDSDPAGTGTHETDLISTRSVKMKKRARLSLSMPGVPDFGGTDDPDQWALYMARAATSATPTPLGGASSPMTLQAAGTMANVVVTSPTSGGAKPPAENNFPGANPGRLTCSGLDASGNPIIDLKGDGSGRVGPLSWDNAGRQIPPTWHTIGAAGEPAFLNGWTGFTGEAPAFALNGGVVFLRGRLNFTGTKGTSAFQLPVGMRPAADMNNLIAWANGPTTIDVLSSGYIQINNQTSNSVIALNGIQIPLG